MPIGTVPINKTISMLLSHRRALDSKFELWKWDRRRSFQSPLQNWHSKSGAEKTRACAPFYPARERDGRCPGLLRQSPLSFPLCHYHTLALTLSLLLRHILRLPSTLALALALASLLALPKSEAARTHKDTHTHTHRRPPRILAWYSCSDGDDGDGDGGA